MAYAMKAAASEEVRLLSLDPSGETTAKIRHARGGDRLEIEKIRIRSVLTYEVDDSTVTEKMPVPDYLIRAKSVHVLLVDTNIIDGHERKWYVPGMGFEDFLKLWNEAEIEVQEALYGAVKQVNPQLGN